MRCRSRGLLRASARSIRSLSDTSPMPECRPDYSVKQLPRFGVRKYVATRCSLMDEMHDLSF